ncbi:MAG: lipid-A-disaccharide synthase [Planctomycetota bacterium]|nr:MAG: lipid-A-disaccharide synthase [Planctomycetota bacterium]
MNSAAVSEKWVAEPPRISGQDPCGLSIESMAMEPTTSSGIVRTLHRRFRPRKGSDPHNAGQFEAAPTRPRCTLRRPPALGYHGRPMAARTRPRILILAGEASGDAHGAELCRALRRLVPEAEIHAWGGPRLAEAGAVLHEDVLEHAVMGLFPVLAHLPALWKLYWRIARFATRWRPDLVIPIDYPGLHLRLARRMKRPHRRVLYYVSPQVWAWWRSRIRRVGASVHRMLVLFPFEVELYRRYGVAAEYVGHPLLDKLSRPPRESLRRRLGLPADAPLLGLFPGSRRAELRRLLPLVLDAARDLVRLRPALRPVLAAANPAFAEAARSGARERGLELAVVHNAAHDLMREARAGLVASGTATLESAYLGMPMVIAYRLDPLSWLGAQWIVQTEHIGLANIVAGREVVPEILDWRHRPRRLVEAALPLLDDGAARERCLAGLAEVRARLGSPGASERAARAALRLLARRFPALRDRLPAPPSATAPPGD